MSHPVTWVTSAGLLGVYPAEIPLSFKVVAVAEPPYIILDYVLISGSLPDGLSFRDDGLIYGTPSTTGVDKTYTFVIRVNASDGSNTGIKDRTFSMEVSGEATPNLIPAADITVLDSIWYTQQISYNNPLTTNPVSLRIISGTLPPGLEMNAYGLIRGYPEPPITTVNLPVVETTVTSVNATNNYLTALSTQGFTINRPITFSLPIANIEDNKTYYIKEIINDSQFTITAIPNGFTYVISTSVSAFTDITLPQILIGQPTKRQYTFTIDLSSPAGNDRQNYTITVVNQNLSTSQGGPGFTTGTRIPTIYNTRPPTYNIQNDSINYGYYVLPPVDTVAVPGTVYPPTEPAYIGQFQSDNFFSFHILGHDFDNSTITYEFIDLPDWLTGDTTTGWIYGNPIVPAGDIQEYNFSVYVYKVSGITTIQSTTFNFSFRISNEVDGKIVWVTDSDLGTLYNSSISYKNVLAESDVHLVYELWSGSLPPNLYFNQEGEIRGVVAYQPTDNYLEQNSSTDFTFSIKAYNEDLLRELSVTLLDEGERYYIADLGNTDFLTVGATQIDADQIEGGNYYFINELGDTDFTEIGATTVTAANLEYGQTYFILSQTTADFILAGAPNNIIGTRFTTGRLTNAGSFTIGNKYKIISLGTTDFTLVGASSNTVGVEFTATGVGSGTGVASCYALVGTGTVLIPEFFAINPGTGTGKVLEKMFYATGAGVGTGTAETYIVQSNKTFTMTIEQAYDEPTDNLYIKCTPSVGDRQILATLLDNPNLIPTNYLYRPNDPYFGKSSSIVYGHAYGIHSSDLEQYIEAVQKNHYWKNITLGELSTAVAKDENGKIIYEVVYSNIIDNLQKYDPNEGVDYRYSTSISENVYWPRFIDLHLGPWYTSNSELYTSYIFAQDAILISQIREYNLLTQTGIPIMLNGGVPTFYTSLTPGYERLLYPNSLDNMRTRVEQTLGANYNFRLLPLWMTSQQEDGNTLGFTPAWVIAYTKPAELITTKATQTYAATALLPSRIVVESTEGFVVGRPIVFSGNTFGNIINGQVYYIKQILSATEIVLSSTITYDANNNPVPGNTYPLYTESDEFYGAMSAVFDPGSYAKIIKEKIENDWNYSLNEIDFDLDRFTVNKTITYDFDSKLSPGTWLDYPSATPTPVPIDSENFYVIFPRRNILSRTRSDIITG